MSKRLTGIGLLLLLCCLALQGCVKANYTQPIAQYQKSVNQSAVVIGSYFLELNNLERDWYLEKCLLNPTTHVVDVYEDTDGKLKHTPLYYKYFSDKGIRARMDSLDLIGDYGNYLAALAGIDAPAAAGAALAKLGDNLNQLIGTFDELAQAKKDPTAADYSKPFSIMQVIVEHAMNLQRQAALDQAIINGGPAVNKILDLLSVDLKKVVQPLRKSGYLLALGRRVRIYNRIVDEYKANLEIYERQKKQCATGGGKAQKSRQCPPVKPIWSLAERKSLLADIQNGAEQYQLAITSNPIDLIAGIRRANASLMNYAKSEKTPQDLEGLVAALGNFETQVTIIVSAFKQMQGGGK